MSTTQISDASARDDASTPTIAHWFDGAEAPSASGRTAPVYNPATGAVRAHVALADDADVEAAIASAPSAGSRCGAGSRSRSARRCCSPSVSC
ncbi:acyl-CoA reductase-like NAD-dependent aldehyde dehydrogenase [Microbacterium testaceum]|nr:acyl-CoA reductase-like NAD-dependent aldehyde dehydrogenase [Microbacterium testaceum]